MSSGSSFSVVAREGDGFFIRYLRLDHNKDLNLENAFLFGVLGVARKASVVSVAVGWSTAN